ncbi:hypothetical protein KKA53_04520 [Candidatus Dependentiae bacterium]|nr:hypothetical protein [Candidatus Dependentiae bacterium]
MSAKNLLALALVASMLTSPALVLAEGEIAPEEAVVLEEEVALEEAVEDTIEPAIQEACFESLMDSRPGTFCRSHIVVVNAVSDPDATHIKLFNPDFAEIMTYKLAKDEENGTWKNINVLRSTKRLYSSGLKFDDKYCGCRTKLVGIALEKLLGLTKHYKGTILLDEYKHYPLWNVILKNRAEVSNFVDYLFDSLAKRGKRSFDRKPVLLLNLKDDPYLESLTLEDTAKLNSLFEVVNYEDTKTTEFFTKNQLAMDEITMRFEASSPFQPGESVRAKLFRKFEKYFKDFDMQEIVPWIIAGTTTTMATAFVWSTFETKLLKPGQAKFSEFLDKFFVSFSGKGESEAGSPETT